MCYLIIINFTMEVASVEPNVFVEKYLTSLGVKEVVCGFDFKFGRFGKGRPNHIKEYSNGSIDDEIFKKYRNLCGRIQRMLTSSCITIENKINSK